jgi:DNA processing protein
MNERSAWIALASVEGVGEATFGRLVADFGGAVAALEAANDGRLDRWVAQRRMQDGQLPISGRALGHLRATAADPRKPLEQLVARGLWTLTPLDTDFPQRLRDLDPPPATIHGLGNAEALRATRSVAVVGTRTPTMAGRALASKVATRLVEWHVVVVSGLAVGIDGAAQSATLLNGGTTVGVIGGGHDSPGPRAHQRLRREVVESGGAVISEYHPSVAPRRGTFPRRNRIIAALGDATIVIEAPIRSGALSTANHALIIDRPVLVAPGRVGDWSTAGSLKLLRETPARPLIGLDEMVEDLLLGVAGGHGDNHAGASSHPPAVAPEALVATLGAAEQLIARRLLKGPAALDLLVADTNLAPAAVSSAVTLLLMRGWVQSVGPAYMVAGALAR